MADDRSSFPSAGLREVELGGPGKYGCGPIILACGPCPQCGPVGNSETSTMPVEPGAAWSIACPNGNSTRLERLRHISKARIDFRQCGATGIAHLVQNPW